MRLTAATIALLLALLGCDGPGEETPDPDPDDGVSCPWDENNDATHATPLTLGETLEAFICPIGDQDWYLLDVPQGNDLLTVGLAVDAPISPIDLTYTLWDGDGIAVLAAPEASEAASSGVPLQVIHGVSEAGQYLLVVRDQGNDADDTRHAYMVTVTGSADPDQNESNNDLGSATEVGGTSIQGYISYRGDEDWYAIEAPENGLLGVRLTMPAGGIEPAFRVVDAEESVLISTDNPAGTQEATDLSYLLAVEEAGTYYVVVSDDDQLDVDPDEPYVLELSADPDPDVNEANDHPSQATELPELTCGGPWTSWSSIEGYIASSGDNDWYRFDLQNCANGVLEVEVEFDNPNSLPEDLEASIRIVREAAFDLCDNDQNCQELNLSCDHDLDCAMYGSLCLASGKCAGAGVCLPIGHCGATLVSAAANLATPEELLLAAPTRTYSEAFVAVADYHSNTYSVDHAYTMRLRVREDPDVHEASEAYTAGPPEQDHENSAHIAMAQEIPVHDCTAQLDCCDGTNWVEGALSYTWDQDWFRYEHPCPGEDCMVRVLYELDGGGVDFYLRSFADGSTWFDNLAEVVDQASHPAQNGAFGGLDPADFCYYAWEGHNGSPFWYYLPIRDTVYISPGHEDDGTWDWDPDQAYRLCVEKIADGCQDPPCFVYKDGCGVPM